jgi:hypothetical protein
VAERRRVKQRDESRAATGAEEPAVIRSSRPAIAEHEHEWFPREAGLLPIGDRAWFVVRFLCAIGGCSESLIQTAESEDLA